MRILATTLAAIAAIGLFPVIASAQEGYGAPPPKSLSVVGSATYETAPTIIRIYGSVVTSGDAVEAARDPHPAKVKEVRAVLDSLADKGLTIDRSTYRLTEDRPFAYDNSPSVTPEMKEKVVYNAKTTFWLSTRNFADIEEIVSTIARSDLSIGTTTFEVDDERAALLEARRAAALDALDQATAYADALGLELRGIHRVVDGDARPIEGYADLGVLSGTVDLSIVVPETIPFHGSVSVVWMVEPKSP